jgi:hypothetical protein
VLARWTYLTALVLIAGTTLASGMMHGYLDGRWTAGVDMEAVAAKLPALPEQAGPWVRVSDMELDPAAEKLLRCDGYLNREYWNPDTGDRVTVAVLLGPRGPIAVHTPEICYSSAGTVALGDRVARTIHSDGETDQLWNVQFGRPEDAVPALDVWYAWSDGGPWQASKYPRFWLTDRLYKIQLAGRAAIGSSSSPGEDFLTHFLPLVRQVL